jgi:predicted type IV restriction endonuclease
MKELKDIIEDICNKLANGVYKKEEHVRLAIIARICQVLGWDIWNPVEFHPEYPIELKNKVGSVDVVLFHSLTKDKTPDVFFEIKSVGKLEGSIRDSEEQLQEYNYYNTASITILTDGRQWRFYLSSAQGTFVQKLFCSFDLLEDKEEYVIGIFREVLSKDRFVKDAVNTAESMLHDLKLSKEISRARLDANERSDKYPELTKFQIVQIILKEHGNDVSIEEIKRLWDIKKPGTVDPPPPPPHPEDYTGTSPLRIFVIDKWFDKNPTTKRLDWSDVKVIVYNHILEKKKTIALDGRKGVFKTAEPTRKQSTKSIGRGYLIDTGFNANTLVKHCCEALESAGYDPQKDLVIELDNSYKMKGK